MNGVKHFLPLALGALMGLMMLRMAHEGMTGQSSFAGWALVGFLGAHVAIVAGGAILVFWATRCAPSLRHRLDKMHRPSWRHLLQMMCSAVVAAATAHLVIHGGI